MAYRTRRKSKWCSAMVCGRGVLGWIGGTPLFGVALGLKVDALRACWSASLSGGCGVGLVLLDSRKCY